MSLSLQQSEEIINTWTMIFLPDSKEKINGRLTVTNQRLVFDMLYNISSFQQVIQSAYLVADGQYSQLEIPKTDIVNVSIEKSFLQKKVIVSVENGDLFTFSHGLMSVDSIVAAIKS